MAVGTPGTGGPFVLLICETWPFARSRLKVSITGPPSSSFACGPPAWLGTITKPLEEDVYLVLQAIRAPINTRATIATVQASLVRILRFISYERADAFPGNTNRACTLFDGVNCDPFM